MTNKIITSYPQACTKEKETKGKGEGIGVRNIIPGLVQNVPKLCSQQLIILQCMHHKRKNVREH